MIQKVVFAVSAAAAALLVAGADRSDLEPAFHNTVVSTYPDGRQARLWLDPDGSYTAEGRKGDHTSGHWTLKGEEICLRQSSPPTLPISYCTAVPPPGGVGAVWAAKSVFGDPLKVTLVPGRS